MLFVSTLPFSHDAFLSGFLLYSNPNDENVGCLGKGEAHDMCPVWELYLRVVVKFYSRGTIYEGNGA